MPTKIMTRLLAGTAISALLTGAAFAAGANARPYDIPQQDAATALQAYAMQSGKQVLFPYEAAKGKQAPQIKGDYSDGEVLALLANSAGLKITADDGKTVTLRPQASAAAQGGDEGTVQALIVTAQKREENIQDVPIAMSAFTQEDLTRSQVAGGPDLMTQVPNFTFTKTNFSGYSIQIRGIGTQAVSATVDPAVAVAFNNTPFIRNRFFEQEFYDLERVEVLRGPQGTLYGRNATAGVVNIISAKPKDHFEARLSADVANYKSSRLEGMINLPLAEDKAALRIAGAWTKRDGFVTNLLTGEQTDGRNLWSTRVTLGLTPTSNITANLIYEHFQENDDRLRSGKQLCHKDPGPTEVGGIPVEPSGFALSGNAAAYFSQGCLPASLYSPDSFETPNGYALPYASAAGAAGAPVDTEVDPYLSGVQSRNLREIETHIRPEYEASTDTVELQLQFDLPNNLTLTSETGFNHDRIFSFEDYNRFDTRPGLFIPNITSTSGAPVVVTDANGVVCDPQLGCTDRLAAGDLSTAKSLQFSQEFRLSSDFDAPFNFSVGANFLRYDTEDKYYVFINSLYAMAAQWSDNSSGCFTKDYLQQTSDMAGYSWSKLTGLYSIGGFFGCSYVDYGNIHSLNDQGRNYFLSKNPYHLLSYAAFGEAYYQITPQLKITAGLRWTVDRKTAPQIPSWLLASLSYGTPTLKVIEQEWKEPTGRFAVDWKPLLSFTDETLLYASYVHGYKAGGANPPPYVSVFPPVCPPSCGGLGESFVHASLSHPETFDPEFVDAYELGTKNTLLDGRLTFNLNGFYYDYRGYQISQIVDRSAVNLNFDAKIWGSELEVDWRPRENLRLGFKGGYENTRLADGSQAVDFMDRVAGHPGWILHKPFPTFPSNCIIPIWVEASGGELQSHVCEAYILHADPATSLPYTPYPTVDAGGNEVARHWGPDYPGYDPSTAPNNGEGFSKDLSGNQLPNAPRFTATITADFTVPLPSDWLMTLHTDLYYQAEAWTRIFNDPGYDKLKSYNNINLAAIFSNEDAGWQVMAYVKNVLDRDNITGAFLNSDDTGLTTNVFLNEPRLYGLRVTKNWNGSAWWGAHTPSSNGYYPFHVEFDGDYGRFSGGRQVLAPPTVSLFPTDHPYPLGVQTDLDDGSAGGVKFTYQPQPAGWSLSGSVRYGRAGGEAEAHPKWYNPGGYPLTTREPDKYFMPWPSYAVSTGESSESYAVADFMVGKDVGLGSWQRISPATLSAGLEYAHFKSDSDVVMHGRPDAYLAPENWAKYGQHMHRFHASMHGAREFEGAGPAFAWRQSAQLWGDAAAAGEVGLDVGAGGSVLLGKQKAQVNGESRGDYLNLGNAYHHSRFYTGVYSTTFANTRTKRVTVPSVNANIGLSYTLGGLKLSGGYRVERYFNAIDGGIEARKSYDRQFDGPYFKVSVGFGG